MSEETPLDKFKHALTGASRAIAREADVEVAWSADAPSSAGKNFRVPLPGRALPEDQVAEARGFADSFSLKVLHHNAELHAQNAPPEPTARACYDAVEVVRYEALGANNFDGMRDNLDAALMMRIGADPITRAQKESDVPVQGALALMVREKLTGQPIPDVAAPAVDMLRDWIEEKVGGDFDALADNLENQDVFQKLTLDMLRELDLTQPTDAPDEGENEDEGEDEDGPDENESEDDEE